MSPCFYSATPCSYLPPSTAAVACQLHWCVNCQPTIGNKSLTHDLLHLFVHTSQHSSPTRRCDMANKYKLFICFFSILQAIAAHKSKAIQCNDICMLTCCWHKAACSTHSAPHASMCVCKRCWQHDSKWKVQAKCVKLV